MKNNYSVAIVLFALVFCCYAHNTIFFKYKVDYEMQDYTFDGNYNHLRLMESKNENGNGETRIIEDNKFLSSTLINSGKCDTAIAIEYHGGVQFGSYDNQQTYLNGGKNTVEGPQKFGIAAWKTELDVFNTEFLNINFNSQSTAIFASQTIPDLTYPFNYKVNIGNTSPFEDIDKPNSFDDCSIGIYELGMRTDIIENTMTNVDYAIEILDASGEINIKENDIDDCNVGININQTNGFTTEIFSNTIATNQIANGIYPVGIYVNNYDAQGTPIAGKINIGDLDEGNTVYSNGEVGIEVNGTTETKLEYNTIIMSEAATAENQWGIKVTDASSISVSDNKINDPDYDGYDCNDITCELDDKTAIAITTSENSTVYCNRMNATYTALQFIDDCNSSKIRGNTFIVHEDAYVLGDGIMIVGSEIGSQIAGNNDGNTELPGNYWKGTDDGTQSSPHTITGETHTFWTIYVPNFETNLFNYSNGFYFPSANLEDDGIAILSDQQSGDPWTCSPAAGLMGDGDFDMARAESIANDSYPITVRETEFRFNLKRGLYATLRKNPELIGSSDVLRDFYDTVQIGSIGLLYSVDSLIALLSDTAAATSTKEINRQQAITINQLINPTNIVESNLQTVNDIFLNTVANHIFTFGSSQTDLENIARQCPFEGGIAVFKARGMLKLSDVTLHWNDETLCALSPRQSDTGNIVISEVEIFPNPTDGLVTVAYHFTDDLDRNFELQDIAGRVLLKLKLPAQKQQVNFNVGSMISGLYFYKISSEQDELNYTGKLTIIH